MPRGSKRIYSDEQRIERKLISQKKSRDKYKDDPERKLKAGLRSRKYYDDNKEFCLRRSRERHLEWRKNNPEKKYLNTCRARARKKGIEFSLVEEDIIFPEFCPVLGIPLEITPGEKTPNTPSVDRIDNTKGYHKDNIRIISFKANTWKSNMTVEDVEKLLTYMKTESSQGET